jgi:hypothetical protein
MAHEFELPVEDQPENQRDTIRQSLNEITAELNSALVRASLAYPVFLCVPSSGNALLTFACSLDPDDNEWALITEIALEIVGKRIGKTQLQTRTCLRDGWDYDGRGGINNGLISTLRVHFVPDHGVMLKCRNGCHRKPRKTAVSGLSAPVGAFLLPNPCNTVTILRL